MALGGSQVFKSASRRWAVNQMMLAGLFFRVDFLQILKSVPQ